MSRAGGLGLGALAVAAVLGACTGDDEPAQVVTLQGKDLLDPAACKGCHEDAFREWSGSMHAYAAEDPVFLAMNRRMQRETAGAAGDFCVKCHAPMAVRLGLTKDGLNLAELPANVRGVTCFFCHEISQVTGSHDAAVVLGGDGVMRGGLERPSPKSPHRAAYSSLHDRERPESASACGACHDVVTPHGAQVERTFAEWQASLYAGVGRLACGKCHMPGRSGVAANVTGVELRTIHDHTMAAVDVALTPFPETDAQRARVQEVLDGTLLAKLCVTPTPLGVSADVTLDNAFAGHAFPSGANQDRRAWVEVVARREGTVVFDSGVVADGSAVAGLADPNLWLLRDRIFDVAGRETHMFWEAARTEPSQLPAAVTNDPLDPRYYHAVTRSYPLPSPEPDEVTMRVRMRPVDFDLLDDLVASGDLAPEIRTRVPTYELASTVKRWTVADGFGACAK